MMAKQDIVYIIKISSIPIIITLIAIITVIVALQHQSKNFEYEKRDVGMGSNINNEMDAIALVLTLPKDMLERSFNELYKYTGGILQSANMSIDKYELDFSKEVLERLLNTINYWNEDAVLFGSLDKFLEERESINSISEDILNDMPLDNYQDNYKKYIATEQFEYNPKIVVKKNYGDSVVYVITNKYKKFVVTFTLNERSDIIIDYKVVDGT